MVPRRRRQQLLTALLGGVALVLLPALPAAADAPGPTDYRSEVTAIEPPAPGLEVEVVGGDGFLSITVDEGHTVEVPGYSGEPYVRIQADGTVQENQESAATFLNQSRNGTDLTRTFDAETEPRWTTVATDGRWAWHDHRIHYMGQGTPTGAATPDGVAWEVPLTADGTDVLVRGRYRLLDAPSPLPWLVVTVVLVAAVVGLARRLEPVTVAGLAVLVAGAAGVTAGAAQRAADPPGVSTSPLIVVLPAVAVVAGVIAVMQRGRVLRGVAVLAGAAAAASWAAIRLPVLWNAELPTSLPAPADRASTAVALGTAVGAAVVAVRSGVLSPPDVITEPVDPAGDA